jgi:transcriptional regulator with XRE-family HTH domain
MSTIDDLRVSGRALLASTMGDRSRSRMVDMDTLGSRVRHEREALKWNQDKLAVVAGVTKQAISKIENGGTDDPKLSTFFALVKTFGVRPEWLAFGHLPKAADSVASAPSIDPVTLTKAITIARQELAKLRKGIPTDRAISAGTIYAYDALRNGVAEAEAARIVTEQLRVFMRGRVGEEVEVHGSGTRGSKGSG